MIRPASFAYNEQTAHSNRFQRQATTQVPGAEALVEFDRLHRALVAAGVAVCVVEDTREPAKPDAVFPNNWVSFHRDGTIVLYPMQAENRRAERRLDVLAAVERGLAFRCHHLLDFSAEELAGRYLEGTGSLVLDHLKRVAYACRSPRTDAGLVREWTRAMGYEAELFDAAGADGTPIYHTNVLLAIGARSAVLCAEVVSGADRERLRLRLEASGRECIEISARAMHEFAANVLELRAAGAGPDGRSILVMSARARAAFDGPQIERLAAAVDQIVDIAIPTIETLGGGGVRCMLAEVPECRA